MNSHFNKAFEEMDKAMEEVFRKTGGTFVNATDEKSLCKRVGYRMPDDFKGVQEIKVYGRKWWQFWLPKTLYLYTVIR